MPSGPRRARCVVLFDSIHHVLAAEDVFRQKGVWCDLVPTPKELSSDCGMSVEFREQDKRKALEVLRNQRVKWRDVYRAVDDGYEKAK